MRKISHLPDGAKPLEKAMSRFWYAEEIPFPWAFGLHLACVSLQQRKRRFNESREHWMRERHGEAAEALRAATRTAFVALGR